MKIFWPIGLLLVLSNQPANAEIIIMQDTGISFHYGAYYSAMMPTVMTPMSTIVFVQPTNTTGQYVFNGQRSHMQQYSPMLQRAHDWSGYQNNNRATGNNLIYQPYTGFESEAQMSLNRNLSRAHQFRLGN